MNKVENSLSYAYEENERITSEINKVLTDKSSSHAKVKKLKYLKSTVNAQLSQNHIDYYLNETKKDVRRFIAGFICEVLVAVYFVFILCRVYWYYNPNKNPFASAPVVLIQDFISYVYLIPIVVIVFCILRKLFKE